MYYYLLNFYPPFLGAGIRVRKISPDISSVTVTMRLRWWNQNVAGTHFGGSLYAMCDPFYALILIEHLGRDFIIWDRESTIRYLKPGRGRVHATFTVTPQEMQSVRNALAQTHKSNFTFHTKIYGPGNEVVAEVDKVVYVRRKKTDRLAA